MVGSPSLGVNLSYSPFASSRAATKRAVDPEPEVKLPPGFTVLPGGNLMYSMADDPLRNYTNASAEYEARLANPRINNLDSPDRLYEELFAPLDLMYGRNRNSGPMRIFETGDGIVAVDPQSLNTQQLTSSAKPAPEMSPRDKVEYSDMLSRRRALLGGTAGSQINKDALAALEAEIEQFKATKFGGGTPAPQNAVAPKAPPMIHIGDMKSDPFAGSTLSLSNAPSGRPKRLIFNPATGKLE